MELRGAPLRLLDDVYGHGGHQEVREYLIEGPAGTGKSCGIGMVLRAMCEDYPGIRILVLRKTRRSLAESWLRSWEQEVLLSDDPCLSGAARTNRHSYVITPAGWRGRPSEVVLGGLDEPENLYSTDYDVICVQQAEQINLSTWIKLRTRVRNFGNPNLRLLMLIADVNPAEPTHWLNMRAQRGEMIRLPSRHEDNPRWVRADGTRTSEGAAFIGSLESMPEGPEKDRLCHGLWSARAGLVWRTYNAQKHLIDAPLATPKWYVGSMDWGTQHPGVLQIWGVDGDDTAYRVREFYARNRSLDWWADKAVQAYEEFKPLRSIRADPSRPDAIQHVNARLSRHTDGKVPQIVNAANNAKTRTAAGDLSGLDLVRVRFGEGRIYLIRNALRERDEDLVEAGAPWCSEMEFSQYAYDLDDEGHPKGELTDKDCADHGMDCIRYAQTFIWGRDLSNLPEPARFKPGSLGHLLGHDRVMHRA